jgi:hypothetical protein
MKPGPVFKHYLTELLDAQLEGMITTKEEGMRWLRMLEKTLLLSKQ